MENSEHKKFTAQAKAAIKGEAFFESLISDYSIPHHIVGPKDVGIDYICEWVYGDRPTGLLYAVQIKTFSSNNVRIVFSRKREGLNELKEYKIANSNLRIDERTLHYWQGLGMPIYLFVIIYSEHSEQGRQLDCYYKRFTPILTSKTQQDDENFYLVNNGGTFLAFTENKPKRFGFARDLFIDLMRCSYAKGSISYISPRTLGLEQFPERDAVFVDLLNEYHGQVFQTYLKAKDFFENTWISNQAVPSAAPDE